jgi:hypothetical protein
VKIASQTAPKGRRYNLECIAIAPEGEKNLYK